MNPEPKELKETQYAKLLESIEKLRQLSQDYQFNQPLNSEQAKSFRTILNQMDGPELAAQLISLIKMVKSLKIRRVLFITPHASPLLNLSCFNYHTILYQIDSKICASPDFTIKIGWAFIDCSQRPEKQDDESQLIHIKNKKAQILTTEVAYKFKIRILKPGDYYLRITQSSEKIPDTSHYSYSCSKMITVHAEVIADSNARAYDLGLIDQ